LQLIRNVEIKPSISNRTLEEVDTLSINFDQDASNESIAQTSGVVV
jgi:hypothetical protein